MSDQLDKKIESPEKVDGRKTLEERFLSSIPNRSLDNLRVLKAHAKLSARELAEVSEISLAALKQIESGRRRMLIHHAMMIAQATGVDVVSLLNGELLLEWGGGKPYNSSSYSNWLENGKAPSTEQEKNGRKQVENLCSYIVSDMIMPPVGDAFLGAHMYVLVGGVEPEVLYSGIGS